MNNTMKSLVRAALLIVLIGVAPNLYAQTAINSTTLSTAQNVSQLTVTIASVTCTSCGTAYANWIVYIDSEAECITGSWDGTATTIPVTRGCLGTRAAPHAIALAGTNKVVYLGPGNRFHQAAGSASAPGNAGDPTPGFCGPRTQYQFLPWINISNGMEWVCDNTDWRGLSAITINGTTPSR